MKNFAQKLNRRTAIFKNQRQIRLVSKPIKPQEVFESLLTEPKETFLLEKPSK